MDEQDILNAVRGEAQRVNGNLAQTRLGLVDGADPTTHTVRVRYQPEDTLSGWLPVMALSVGPGWGLHALPAIGAQVLVGFQEGGAESGVVLGALYSAQQTPPDAPAGAIWLVSKGGARFQLNPDGSADLLSGSVRIGGLEATMQRLVREEFMALFNLHSHPSNGAPPSQKMTVAHLTTNLTAS